MPNVVGKQTLDTPSTDGYNCLYPAKALGGTPHVSPNVKFEDENVEFYDSTSFVDPADSVKINPVIPAPCAPGVRTIIPKVNTTVHINGKLVAVSGDKAQCIPTTDRLLTGPYKYPTIPIANSTLNVQP
jgi:uncharacterized Zn-binding protein involved in type VI secretion